MTHTYIILFIWAHTQHEKVECIDRSHRQREKEINQKMTPIWHLSMIGWANNTLESIFQTLLQFSSGSICVRGRSESNTKINCCFYISAQHQKLAGNVRHAMHTLKNVNVFLHLIDHFLIMTAFHIITYTFIIFIVSVLGFIQRFFFQVICISMHPSCAQHWNVAYRTALILYIEMMIAPIKCALRNCYARQQQQHTNYSNQINWTSYLIAVTSSSFPNKTCGLSQ